MVSVVCCRIAFDDIEQCGRGTRVPGQEEVTGAKKCSPDGRGQFRRVARENFDAPPRERVRAGRQSSLASGARADGPRRAASSSSVVCFNPHDIIADCCHPPPPPPLRARSPPAISVVVSVTLGSPPASTYPLPPPARRHLLLLFSCQFDSMPPVCEHYPGLRQPSWVIYIPVIRSDLSPTSSSPNALIASRFAS